MSLARRALTYLLFPVVFFGALCLGGDRVKAAPVLALCRALRLHALWHVCAAIAAYLLLAAAAFVNAPRHGRACTGAWASCRALCCSVPATRIHIEK